MPRAVLTPDGRVVFVDRNGVPMTRYNPGYQSQARMMDLLSRLPDAQLKGATGFGIKTPEQMGRDGAPPVQDMTVRPLSGLDSNSRGMTLVLPPPTISGAPGTVNESGFRTLVDMRSRGPDSELLNITLNLMLGDGLDDRTIFPFGNNVPMVQAVLDWGIGGAQFSAVCDWLQGTQLSIPANTLRVSAQYVNVQNLAGPAPPSFIVSAGLSYGNTGRMSSPARFTERLQILPGFPVDRKIPKYATGFAIASNSPCLIDVGPFVGGLLQYSFVPPMSNAGQRNVENSFPLPNGVRSITITNTSGVSSPYAIIYTLAI